MELVHVAVLLGVIFQVSQCSVSVGEKSVEVRPGDEANLSCASSNIIGCIFQSPDGKTLFLKKGVAHEGGRISYSGEDESTECNVRISNIEEKDNGEWKCILTTLSGSDTRTLEEPVSVIVSKAPASVRLEVDGQVSAPIMVVNIRETTSKQVSCISERARPAATFSWMLGEDEFSGSVVDGEAEQHEDGSVTQVQTLNYDAKPSHNGKTLTCIVNHSGFSRDQLTANQNMASVDLDVQFLPVPADHPQAFYNLKIGETQEIVMSFRAHPRPTQVFWSMYDQSEVAEGGESLNKRFRAEILQDNIPNEGQFTAKLIINEVMEKDAGSTNILSVTNELGTTKYPFTLSLGDKPASAGTGPVIAIVIVAIIIIVVIVVAVIARSQGMLCFADPPKPEEDKEKAVEKEEGSETESAKGEETAKDEVDDAAVEDGEILNNNTTKKTSMTAKMTSLFSAVKKSVGGRKEKYSEGGEAGEVKLPLQTEGKENGVETDERKDDSIVYADLDKSAMSVTGSKVSVENEKTTYAEIKPDQTKEK